MGLGACHGCASGSDLAFHVDFRHKFIAYGFFAEDTPGSGGLGTCVVDAEKISAGKRPYTDGRAFASGSYLQDLLTILTEAISISPCSSLFFFIPAEVAASLASSFALCIVTLETVPLAVIVWPT